MRKILFSNSKGGVGKTTACLNTGAGLARQGKRTLLIDTDSQGQLSQGLGVTPDKGLADLLSGEPIASVLTEARDNLYLIAGGPEITPVKHREIDLKENYALLRDRLQGLRGFEFVLIDTPPSWDLMAINAMHYAAEIVIPVSLEVMAIQGLSKFLSHIADMEQEQGKPLTRWILPMFYDRRVAKSDEILDQLREYFENILPPIRYNVRLSEAPGYGETIFEYAKRSAGAEDFQTLVERIRRNE